MIVVSVEGIVQLQADAVTIHKNDELEPDHLRRLIELGGKDDLVVCRIEVLRRLIEGAKS